MAAPALAREAAPEGRDAGVSVGLETTGGFAGGIFMGRRPYHLAGLRTEEAARSVVIVVATAAGRSPLTPTTS